MPITDKIQAIKDVRTQTGCGLKEAKDAVEASATLEDAVQLVRNNQPKKYAELRIEAAPRQGYVIKTGVVDIVAALSTLGEVYDFIGENLAEGR